LYRFSADFLAVGTATELFSPLHKSNGLVVDRENRLYVTQDARDGQFSRIEILSTAQQNTVLQTLQKRLLNNPFDIAIDDKTNVYVTSSEIQFFSNKPKLVSRITRYANLLGSSVPADTDGDGISDVYELQIYGTNPGLFDTDGDGLGDGIEVGISGLDADPDSTTDPLLPDTDGDGRWDGNNGINPCEDCNNNGQVDAGESNPNALEAFIHFNKGWNLFSYPSDVPAEHAICSSLAIALGGFGSIESITRLNPDTGLLEHCDVNGGVDFPVVPGEAYIVRTLEQVNSVWSWHSYCPERKLAAGVNFVGNPAAEVNLTCYSWLEAQMSEAVGTIEQYNNETGRFEFCTLVDHEGTGERAAGSNFSIRAGQGYIFHATSSDPLVYPGCP